MAVDTQLFAVIPKLSAWAVSKSNVQWVCVFGSRVRGTQQRADSDLDVAIGIDVLSADAETQLRWMDDTRLSADVSR